jgi:hypothetical protein
MKKLPKLLWARIEKESSGDEFAYAYETLEEAIDGDGPTTIGVYKLQETIKRRKIVAVA